MSRRTDHLFIKLPIELAPVWHGLSVLVRGVGGELFRVYQESVIELGIDQAEDVIVRMLGPEPSERKAVRHAIRKLIASGLLVPVEGGIRLLYSRNAYRAHHAEGGPTLPASSAEGGPTVPQPHADHTPKVAEGAPTVVAKPPETLEPHAQIDREIDREREGSRSRSKDSPVVARGTVRERCERDDPLCVSSPSRIYQRCAEQVASALNVPAHDVQGYLAEWGSIASKPAHEWERVLERIQRDPWCLENRGKVSPRHLLRKWPDYSQAPAQSAQGDAPAVPRAERVRDLRARLSVARERRAAAATDREREDAGLAVAHLERELVSLAGPDALELDEPAQRPRQRAVPGPRPARDPEADLAAYQAEKREQRA